MNNRLFFIAFSVVSIGLIGILLSSHPWPRRSRPVQFLIGTDTSLGCRPHLPDAALRQARLAALFDPDADSLVLYRVDAETAEFYNNVVPPSAERLLETLNRELKPLPRRNGTYPAIFFAAVSKRVQASSQDVVVVYFSDGDNDDASRKTDAALCKVGQDLAANAHVRGVIFADVSSENRRTIERQFRPLGSRLHLHGITDSDLETLSSDCEKALHSPHS